MFAIIVHFNIQNLKNKQTFIQTEKAKSSHFDRTRGDKNQIFPTLVSDYAAQYLGKSKFIDADIKKIMHCLGIQIKHIPIVRKNPAIALAKDIYYLRLLGTLE